MFIIVLSENTSSSAQIENEHGLSLYIETANHKILFDVGASGIFARNAMRLGVDLTKVDSLIISHGHYDHGGGIGTFLAINSRARIYFQRKAFEKLYSLKPDGVRKYIGLDETLQPNERFIFCDDHFVIDDELSLFSGVKPTRLFPSGNAKLLMKAGDVFVQDNFAHEQNLIIRDARKTTLISGCAHNGIVNIIDHFKTENAIAPDYVVSGFHLYDRSLGQSEDARFLDEMGRVLMENATKYYTCHCTGIEPYARLKAMMGGQIDYLAAGDQLTLE